MCILAVVDLFLFQFNVSETKGKPLVDNMPPKEHKLFKSKNDTEKSIELLPRNKNET